MSSKVQHSEWDDWAMKPLSTDAQQTQSINQIHQKNIHINNTSVVDVVQDLSQVPPKAKSNFQCKPLQWWSSMPPCLRGVLLGALVSCLGLAIILPIWLVKPSKTTTIAPVNAPLLRWNTTGITLIGITGTAGIASNQLLEPWDLTLDWANTLYVTDRYNHRIQKFLMNAASGTTIAGQINGTYGMSMNQFNQPTGIYVDLNGDMFISDANNNRVQFWSNGASSGQTLVGNGTAGNGSNQLYYPYGIWRDISSGTLYVADSYNHRIMRYLNNAPSGDVVAGGNGVGTNSSQLSFPYAFYVDSLSNSLLIANAGANNIVRWVLGASSWALVAGNISGSSGNTATLLSSPTDVALDPMGNMYVADMNNQRIQFFASGQSNGITIAGIVGSNATLLGSPSSLALDGQLNLYVVDGSNNRVQKFARY